MANSLFTRLNCSRRMFLLTTCVIGLVVIAIVTVCVIYLRPSGKSSGGQVNPSTETTVVTATSLSSTSSTITTISTSPSTDSTLKPSETTTTDTSLSTTTTSSSTNLSPSSDSSTSSSTTSPSTITTLHPNETTTDTSLSTTTASSSTNLSPSSDSSTSSSTTTNTTLNPNETTTTDTPLSTTTASSSTNLSPSSDSSTSSSTISTITTSPSTITTLNPDETTTTDTSPSTITASSSTNSSPSSDSSTRSSTISTVTTSPATPTTLNPDASTSTTNAASTTSNAVTTSSTTNAASTTSTTNSISTTTQSTTTTTIEPGECEIYFGRPTDNIPLLLDPKTNKLLYPEINTYKSVGPLEQIEVSCLDKQVIIGGKSLDNYVTATCLSGSIFEINGHNVNWTSMSCSTPELTPTITTIDGSDLNKNCNSVDYSLKLVTIGVQFNSSFFNIVQICFNVTSEMALYSNYELTSSIAKAGTPSKPKFKQDNDYYNNFVGSVSTLYEKSKATINEILGMINTSDVYINGSYYIDKGHLAANTDFYYASLQTAVNRFINVAPRWNTVNQGNWNQMETDVKNYASAKKIDLQIWTGTYGNAVLKSTTSEPTQIYLYVGKGYPVLPVPEVFWRIVYNPVNESGIVLVGHNNPYEEITKEQEICNEHVSVSWLNWDMKDFRKGYSYACEYGDEKFHSLVLVTPNLTVNHVLE